MNASLEQQCLLLLARGALTAEEQGRARGLLAEPLAWDVIARSADDHGVLPLVARNLRRLGWSHVPDAVRTQLERAEYLNAVRNRLLVRGLGTILGRFARAGIPAIALKGVALAESLYGDASLRVCSDVDVLVPGSAVGRAIEVLRADGFRDADRYQARAAEMDLLLRSNMEYCLVSPPPGFQYMVELHWDIAWRWRADSEMVDHLWAEARPGAVLGTDAWVLSPEWELLHLAFHAARHRWSALKWLVDVHEVCARGGLDWTGVQERARRFGLDRALDLTLGTCRALLGTPLPPAIAQHVPPRPRALPAVPEAVGGWQESLSAVWLFGRSLDRLRYLGRLLLGPTLAEWSLVRLPSRLRFLYHGLRPLRLGLASGRAMVGGTKLLGFLTRDAHTPRSTDGS